MDCTQFLTSFTDYRDGLLAAGRRARVEEHLASCPSCRRYCRVVDEGVRLLRAAPSPSVSEDFRPRLKHRIYHVEDGDSLSYGSASGVSGVVAVGMAVLLGLAAWSPVLEPPEAEVRLPALVVSGPPEPAADPILSAPTLFDDRATLRWAERWDPGPAWEHPTALLLEYSPLFDRYRSVGRSVGSLD